MQRAFSSEFPNDNAELHLGTIWMSVEPCGRAEAHLPEEPPLEELLAQALEQEEEDDDEGAEPIEIVDSIAIEEPDEVVPAPVDPIVPVALVEPAAPIEIEEPIPPAEEEPVEPASVPAPAFSEVVLSSRRAEEIGEALVIPPSPVPVIALEIEDAPPPPPALGPYAAFLQTLSEAAAAVGGALDAGDIEARLAGDAVGVAWRAILLGESEDFSLCATTLDEWAAATLATLLDAPSKAAQLRRELRARGVAAFGLVEAA